jgi:hypothetical protein
VTPPGAERAQSEGCSKLQPLASAAGYALRGSGCSARCEGLYVSDVSLDLQIVSLLRGGIWFPSERAVTLRITAPKEIDEQINVRAVAIPLRTYYRMDSTLRRACVLNWPTVEVLLSYVRLRPDEIGVFGWTGGENDKTFVPLAVSEKDQYSEFAALTMTVRTAVEVAEVAAQAIPLDPKGKQAFPVQLPVSTDPQSAIRIDLSRVPWALFKAVVNVRERDTESWQRLEIRIRER